MTKLRPAVSGFGLASYLAFVLIPAAGLWAQDLSRYRGFQFGTDLPAVAKQAGIDPSLVTLVHSRPALIQSLKWLPWLPGSASQTEAVKQVVFTFYNGELCQIAIDYDRYQIAGLTAGDLIEAISANYGVSAKVTWAGDAAPKYGEQQDLLAEWQDAQYRFDLMRGSYGNSFRLMGILKRLETPLRTANAEAVLLDEREAPQREAELAAKANEAQKAALAQDRLVNKPKFRP